MGVTSMHGRCALIGTVFAASLGFAAPAPAEVSLPAIKLDVLCRGGHGSARLEVHGHWCAGYAQGVLDALRGGGSADPQCIPPDAQALWDRFGAWLVANPDERLLPARDALPRALRHGCDEARLW